MNDMPSVANVVKGKGMDARFRDKEKNREREMNAHNLHVEKEILQQRSKIARQVLKGVAKLPQIRKMRDVFLPKHVSVLQLARLLNIRLGEGRFPFTDTKLKVSFRTPTNCTT